MSKVKSRIGLALQFAFVLGGYALLLLCSSPKANAAATLNGEWLTGGSNGPVCDCTSPRHTCFCQVQDPP